MDVERSVPSPRNQHCVRTFVLHLVTERSTAIPTSSPLGQVYSSKCIHIACYLSTRCMHIACYLSTRCQL